MNPIIKKISKNLEGWIDFIGIILSPIYLSLLVASILLYLFSIKQTDGTIVAVMTLIVSLFTGILGGIYAKKWDDISSEKVIVARGKSAIRSLKLLFTSTVSLERRVCVYLERCNESNRLNRELVRLHLEDVIERCNLLEEEVLSSIENWTDIIPEADVKTQIGLLSKLKLEVEDRTAELILLNEELEKTKDKSLEDKESLKKEIVNRENELKKTRRELTEQSYEVQTNLFSSTGSVMMGTSTPSLVLGPPKKICKMCGVAFDVPISLGGISKDTCPKCDKFNPLSIGYVGNIEP